MTVIDQVRFAKTSLKIRTKISDQVGQIKRKEAEEARKKAAEQEEDFGTFDSWDFGILFEKRTSDYILSAANTIFNGSEQE